jgi:hypothetical protein
MRTNFWSPEALLLLKRFQRQDLIDRGDALAERVTALLLTARNRLEKYVDHGALYEGKGGKDLMGHPDSIIYIEDFVNNRLRAEIDALENLLNTFDDIIPSDSGPVHTHK